MVYESSYDTGRRPFRPDATRGYWSQPSDFVYACLGAAFKLDVFSIWWFYFFDTGIFSLIPYLIVLALFIVPVIMVQSFMGQFSSTGFISALRICPLFKGMGYISIALNLTIISYLSVSAAIPMFYFIHSLRPTMPWECESYLEWYKEVPGLSNLSLCNATNGVIKLDSTDSSGENNSDIMHAVEIPAVVFLRKQFHNYKFLDEADTTEIAMAWQVLICMFMMWGIVAFIFYKITTTAKLGTFIRYAVWTLISLLLLVNVRLVFLEGAQEGLMEFIYPKHFDAGSGLGSIALYAVASFGAGWGTTISLASYNPFRTNITRLSWLIGLGQMLILTLFGFITFLVDKQTMFMLGDTSLSYMEHHWALLLTSASVLSELELANLWTLIFFSCLTMGSILVIVTELFALLTAIFDDCEYLRERKLETTFGTIGLLAITSIYFCTNHGLLYFTALAADALFSQTVLNLLLLLVVLWIYGRVRFQRDIEFMLSQRFSSWHIWQWRFVTPFFLLLTLLISITVAYFEHVFSSVFIYILAVLLIGIPWCFIPAYAGFSLIQTSGSFWLRIKRCCHPTDWYPVEQEERQRYEESMGNMDITHQLNEVGEEIL